MSVSLNIQDKRSSEEETVMAQYITRFLPFHRKIRYQSEIVASGPCDIQLSKPRFQSDISSISTCSRRSQHVARSLNRWHEEEKV